MRVLLLREDKSDSAKEGFCKGRLKEAWKCQDMEMSRYVQSKNPLNMINIDKCTWIYGA